MVGNHRTGKWCSMNFRLWDSTSSGPSFNEKFIYKKPNRNVSENLGFKTVGIKNERTHSESGYVDGNQQGHSD